MKKRSLLLLAAIASLAASPAIATDLRGDAFITAMNGNTLSGKNAEGVDFNLYFLPGGELTYQDTSGKTETGSWKLDNDGDVCVEWLAPAKAENGCYQVKAEGKNVTWSGKNGTHHGGLHGEVAPLSMAPKTQ